MIDKPQYAPPDNHPSPAQIIIIDAEKPTPTRQWQALWEHRELLMFMVWREWSVRYKQTVFGVAWVVMQPIAMTIIFSVIFSLFIRTPSYDIPYPLFFLTGLVPFRYFMESVSYASGSLVQNAQLVGKVYFPRLLIPISAAVTSIADFFFAFLVVMLAILIFGFNPLSLKLLMLPLLLGVAMLLSMGLGALFAALNVRYRDVGQFLPFVLQVWFYATPVIYPLELATEALPGWAEVIYRLNPMLSVVQGFRWALLGTPAPDPLFVLLGAVGAVLVLAGSLFYFTRVERYFGEVI